MNLKQFWNKGVTFAEKNSSVILTGLSIAGMVTTAIAAYKASPKAHEIMQKYHDDMKLVDKDDKEAKREVIKETVKDMTLVMAPSVIMGATTAACIIGGHKVNAKKIAVLSAAYNLADGRLKDYQEKIFETAGEQKLQKVREAIAKDHLQSAPDTPNNLIIGDGNVLCMDSYTKRYFQSSAQKIGQAINELSSDVISDMYVTLNDFYDKIGLDQTPIGESFGWNTDDLQRGTLPIYFTAVLTKDNQPCLVVEYECGLKADFKNLH